LFGAKARKDVLDLYDYIAEQGHPVAASGYIARIERWCQTLGTFPKGGTARDDIRPGLRVVGFERRVLIGFQISGNAVFILRVLYGGRNISGAHFAHVVDPKP
jgi:toxin ParE1/3/4